MKLATLNIVLDIPLGQIRAFRGQPRRYFQPEGLRKLAKSIATRGQETPGTVRPVSSGDGDGAKYELIDGERRFRACAIAKLPTFRAIVCDVADEEDQFERSVVSNFGREGHPPMEIAAAIKRLRKRYTIEETAERLAKSPGWVSLYQSLLGLDPRVQAMLDPSIPEEKQLKFTLAARLARVPDQKLQVEAAQHIVAEQLSARKAELYIRRLGRQQGVAIGKSDAHDEGRSIERFIDRLEDDTEMLLNARQIDFARALGGKTFGQLRMLIAQLDECVDNVSRIRDAVRAVHECRQSTAPAEAVRKTA